jgi:hypothetical protein
MGIIVAFLLLILVGATGVFAQQAATATLSGRVTDPNGAVIVGAKIIATQKATGAKRETVTNDEGMYALTNLPPGDYEVKMQASGFKTKTSQSPVALQVGRIATLDAQLNVGDVRETVIDLTSDAPVVDTASTTVDGFIQWRQIENLPLNGRNYLELALLIPGNTPAPNFDPTKTSSVIISSAGQLGRGGNITIDGTDNNDDAVGGPLINISQDAVQEFQIATNRFSADLGRSASSVINVVTKAGSNDLHGSFSFFERDRRLQGLPATFDRSNQEPPFDRQQYSATLGGPIKKDRAWWFGAFEYRNQDGAVLVGERDVAARRIRRGFALAPHNDLLGLARGDWKPSDRDNILFRYAIERLDDTGPTKLDRAIGSASQRQNLNNNHQAFLTNWVRVFSPTVVNSFSFSVNNFSNNTVPLSTGPQLTFPSILDGVSFRVPQATKVNRLQFSDALSVVRGAHTFKFGGDVQRVDMLLDLGVFQQGRIEFVQDFAQADFNGDGRVDDSDLLFAVTLRSSKPTQSLLIDNTDNNYFAMFAQDDWRVSKNLTLSLGLRYELDTNVNNNDWYGNRNPIVQSFYRGERKRDLNNFAPRVGFNWATNDGRTSVHGGYGIYYDRITLEIATLERGLDGRALAIEVRAGNALSDPTGAPIFIDPATGRFRPFAPTLANPFTGFILPGAGASGINIIDNGLQNPMVQQFNLGVQREVARNLVARADYVHNFGARFIIGRTIGVVNNPVVGGPDRVVNLESSVKTKYDGLLLSLEKRFSNGYQFRASYTLSKAFNYANDDQIPFSNGPVDPSNMQLEYGPTPNDRRHYFTFSGAVELPYGFQLAPVLTLASGVPMDILLPDASSRVRALQRNAGGRLFKTGAELNSFLQNLNAAGGVNGQPLPLVRDDARFNDNFSSLDLRMSKVFRLGDKARLEPIVEVFNLFNVTNILGVSNVNYSGFSNVLTRDSDNRADPGFLRSSGFGNPVTTAGGVFGSGGPRAFQIAAKFSF